MHRAIDAGLVRACHDLSEGGLAVAAAEMAFAGGLGAEISADSMARTSDAGDVAVRCFSESNTRFLCEVRPADADAFRRELDAVPCSQIGRVIAEGRLSIRDAATVVVRAEIGSLKEAWQRPLKW